MTSSTRHPYRSAHARFNPRLPGGRRPHTDVTRQTPPGTRQEPARSPHRARAGPLARMVARAPTSIPDRDSVTRRRFAPDAARNAPGAAQNAPGASQKPVPRARRPLARIVARAQTGVPARDSVTRRRFAPDAAQNAPGASQKPRTRQEPARSPERARSQPEARTARAPSAGACRGARTDRRTSPHRRYAPAPPRTRQEPPRTRQEPARSPYRARAVRWRVSWRAHRPAYQPATALRASASRQTPPGTRQEPAASAYRALLRFSTITDPVRIRLRRPGIA